MNCDQAFDLMTDPSRDDSPQLHAHLDGCPRCRQMYETLSPALGLFDAATHEELRGAESDLRATSVELAERVAVRLSHSPTLPKRSRRIGHLRMALGCLMAGGLGFLAAALWTPLRTASPEAVRSAEGCTWVHRGPATDQPAGSVVVSCVKCHVSSADSQRQSTFLQREVPTQFAFSHLPLSDVSNWLDLIVWNSDTVANS
jgi:hypothetical protein